MLTIDGAPEDLEGLYRDFKDNVKALFAAVEHLGRMQCADANQDLFEYIAKGNLIYLQEGFFRLHRASKVVRLYSEGDIIGFREPPGDCALSSEYTADVILLERRRFLDTIKERADLIDRWLEIEDLENRINLGLSLTMARDRVTPSLMLVRFRDGETIIDEGSLADEIYEMISGSATVEVRNVPVGTIKRGEIFGEMSSLAECPRTATVRAKGPCCIRVVQKETFLSLIQSDAHLAESIAKTLAKRIIELNERLVGPIT
jgi:CRP-like cAMP-binding protein